MPREEKKENVNSSTSDHFQLPLAAYVIMLGMVVIIVLLCLLISVNIATHNANENFRAEVTAMLEAGKFHISDREYLRAVLNSFNAYMTVDEAADILMIDREDIIKTYRILLLTDSRTTKALYDILNTRR